MSQQPTRFAITLMKAIALALLGCGQSNATLSSNGQGGSSAQGGSAGAGGTHEVGGSSAPSSTARDWGGATGLGGFAAAGGNTSGTSVSSNTAATSRVGTTTGGASNTGGASSGQGGITPFGSNGGSSGKAGAPSGGRSNGGESAISGLGGTGGVVGIGGTKSNGGTEAAGANATGGTTTNTSVSPPSRTSAVNNGLRGQDFDSDWKFNRGDVTGAEKPAFDDSKWKSLDVPHDWSIELAFSSSSPSGSSGGYLDGGIGWYRKTFTLDQAVSEKRVFIDFDGVYMNSQVWVNGTSLGTRPYGYSSFEYDLTPYVKFGGNDNVIAVKVNNNQPNSRWYSGSGIYRHVWLTILDPVHIPNSGAFVSHAISGSSANISVSTDVQNQGTTSAQVTVTSTIIDASGAPVASNDSAPADLAAATTSTIRQSLTIASPRLWSPASPNLYRVQIDVKSGASTLDTYVAPLGIRTASFNPTNGFSLNGESIKLQGVNMHHDLGALGAAVNYRAIERQVQILKRMGVNAIRTSHNPPAPELLDITDRLGVLVLDEAFDTWTQTKTTNDYGKYFNDWAQRDIQDMVRRDRNHPSVILWSIGNEVGGATTTIAQKLKDWVLAVDKTRPVTWASNKMGGPHISEGDDRNVAKLLDVVGYNYAPYAGDYDADHTANPNWVILGTETAAAVRSRGIYHTPASTITKATSQSNPDRQCSSYDNEATGFGATAESAYEYDHGRAFVAGSFIWSGFDYIGEPTPYSAWPSKSSYFGAIDTAGFPKDIYYFYQSRWTTAPMVHLLPHWNWTSGTNVTVYAYGNCDSVELFLNEATQGSKTLSGGTFHFQWSIPWASGTLRADCKSNGSVVASATVKTAGAAAKIVLSADRSSIHADGKDLVFITADVQDATGVIVPTAENSITFSISGAGQLVGVDNGNPVDTSSYKGSSRKAFSGKALAIIRASLQPGAITVNASSTGLASDSLTVDAQTVVGNPRE